MKPRNLSLVKFNIQSINDEIYEKYYKDIFELNKIYLFLGECSNTEDHYFIINLKTNKLMGMYHTENFIEISEEN
ncbi:MAG: hypothetical protein P8X70_01495 [Nanoarchaeota archaeon]